MTPRTPHAVDKAVGARVRDLRLKAGMNQSELGRALGLTFQQVQKYESGANRISCSKLVDISRALKVKPAYFLEGLDGDGQGAEMPEVAIASPQERRLLSSIAHLPPAHISALADLARAITPATA